MNRTLKASLEHEMPAAFSPIRTLSEIGMPSSLPVEKDQGRGKGLLSPLPLKWSRRFAQPYIWLLLPALLLLLVFFLFPIINMIKYSFYTQVPGGTMQPDFTVQNFEKFFSHDLYGKILLKTLFNALITTLLALILGYPVAFAIARGHPWLSRILVIAVISPLLVGIVIRTYGWTVLLSRQGLVNQLLLTIGIIDTPVRFMGNDVGIILSLLHVLYPFMVLPLAAALQKIDCNLEEAAMVLGANRLQVFLRVLFPLSIPGVLAGSIVVFLLSASSYVTPRLIGQNLTRWFLNLVEEQVLIVFNWPFGAAMATVFIAVLVLMITGYHRVLESKFAFLARGKDR
jgi:putative spermidine/putrescine transport system permease protein